MTRPRIESALLRRQLNGAVDELIAAGDLTELPNGQIVFTEQGRARLERERRASYPPAFDPDAPQYDDQLRLDHPSRKEGDR